MGGIRDPKFLIKHSILSKKLVVSILGIGFWTVLQREN